MKDARAFLASMASTANAVEHADNCGMCEHASIMAFVAAELLEQNVGGDLITAWSDEVKRRWQGSKYYLLFKAEKMAGRDPAIAFEGRGWEM